MGAGEDLSRRPGSDPKQAAPARPGARSERASFASQQGKEAQGVDLSVLKGVGPKRADLFHQLGIFTVQDLLEDLPRAYEDRGHVRPVAALEDGVYQTVRVSLQSLGGLAWLPGKRTIQQGTFVDPSGTLKVRWHNQPYLARNLRIGDSFYLYGRYRGDQGVMDDPKMAKFTPDPELEPAAEPRSATQAGSATESGAATKAGNEAEVRANFLALQPIYALTAGLKNPFRLRLVRQAFAEGYGVRDWLDPALIPTLGSYTETLYHLHCPDSQADIDQQLEKLEARRALDQVLIREELGRLRKNQIAQALDRQAMDPYYQALPFAMTPSQRQATEEILADLWSPLPMNRLLQGDVGSGKTAVALAAAYQVLANGYQVAFMAPTEILASQHADKSRRLFGPLGFPVYLLTGSSKGESRRELKAAAESGQPALFIGTHALFADRLHFSHLALTITDEQHRFGVEQRGALQIKAQINNQLVLSATPIPRTLALVHYGDLDLSRITGQPAGRQSRDTFVVDQRYEQRVYRYLGKKALAGEQAYVVCPRIEEGETDLAVWSLERVQDKLSRFLAQDLDRPVIIYDEAGQGRRLEPETGGQGGARGQWSGLGAGLGAGPASDRPRPIRLGLLTGGMAAEAKEGVMAAFAAGQVDILLATSVIEVGIDVANATTMLVLAADRFGLAQLHQLRGRVGRGEKKSICIFLAHSPSKAALDRLKFLEQTEDGLAIAEKDLALRGAGDRYGTQQHGLEDPSLLPVDRERLEAAQDLLVQTYGSLPRLADLPGPWQERLKKQLESLERIQRN